MDQLVIATPDEPLAGLYTRLNRRPHSPAAGHTAGHVLVTGADGDVAGVLTPADFGQAARAAQAAQAPRTPGAGPSRATSAGSGGEPG